MKTLSPDNNYYMGSSYSFQGFIYNPTEFTGSSPTPEPTTEPEVKRFPFVLYARKLRKKY